MSVKPSTPAVAQASVPPSEPRTSERNKNRPRKVHLSDDVDVDADVDVIEQPKRIRPGNRNFAAKRTSHSSRRTSQASRRARSAAKRAKTIKQTQKLVSTVNEVKSQILRRSLLKPSAFKDVEMNGLESPVVDVPETRANPWTNENTEIDHDHEFLLEEVTMDDEMAEGDAVASTMFGTEQEFGSLYEGL
jgi:hypothetical protein